MAINNTNKTSAFIIGAAIGSVVALMFAPFSGKKMRRVTTEKGKKALGEAKDKYTDFENTTLKPNLEKAKFEGKKLWNKTSKDVQDKATDIKDGVEEKAQEFKDDASDKVISLRNRFSRKAKEVGEETEI